MDTSFFNIACIMEYTKHPFSDSRNIYQQISIRIKKGMRTTFLLFP
ncbi:hypothetical protein IX321_001797 [Bacteroides pyogenes]|nr:hypothetical protein [Bacteroides pyogenes]MBR8708990.1 hypothetical protein [Bacteroides pyogenes]MBR8717787.1 hypothetical protein [Bacteroides pyogenes]MBR8747290.1 hypothetical protein [Bacteroides pyogenes]MBR8757635.1 hypothetical protein [Bacteroides pyogenes]